MKLDMQPGAMDAWKKFLQTHKKVLSALEQEMLDESGLPLPWYDVLVQLHEAPEGRLRLQTLAERILLSRSGLTRLIDRMAAERLVAREPCPDDRRGTYAVVTTDGKLALRRAAPGHLRGIQEHFARHLSPESVASLREALSKVLEAGREAAEAH